MKTNLKNIKKQDLVRKDSAMITRIAQHLMRAGHKNNAYKLLENSISIKRRKAAQQLRKEKPAVAREHIWRQGVDFCKQAIRNTTPSVETRRVRRGGTPYQVPYASNAMRRETLAVRWLVEQAYKRKRTGNNSYVACLADEFLEAAQEQGGAIQKRDELHAKTLTNRAYARLRWW